MSSAEHKKVVENLVAALCAHNTDKVVSCYDPNCEVSRGGQVLIRSKEELRNNTEQRFLDPNYMVRIIEFIPIEGDDRVRFIAEDKDKKRYDEICVFSKEGKVVQLMITNLDS